MDAKFLTEWRVRSARIRERAQTFVVVVSLGLLLAAIAVLLFQSARRPGFLSAGVPECRVAYERARTASDTAMVDLRHPSSGPQKDPNAPTCGTLRVTGQLR